MTDDRERWALILGASSGMGEATSVALARAGYRICGIHLDFRAGIQHVEEVKKQIVDAGSEALYTNMNAADDEKRASALASGCPVNGEETTTDSPLVATSRVVSAAAYSGSNA